MRLILFLLLTSVAVGEELSGKLVDGTKGGSGKVDSLQLIHLEDSMKVLGTLTNVDGNFTFETDEVLNGKHLLLQANKDGVMYSKGIQWPSEEGVVFTIYEADPNAEVSASIGSMAFYAYAQSIDIGIFYNLNNVSEPKRTKSAEGGSFSFDLIAGHSALDASTRRGSMPLRQSLEVEGNRATLNYPLKPGATQLMVRTRHIYNPNEENLIRINLPPDQGSMNVLCLPRTLEVSGNGLEKVNEDPKENMSLYEYTHVPGQTVLELKIKGKPLDKPLDDAATTSATTSNQSNSTQGAHAAKVERRPHHLDKYRWHIIAAMLGLFLIVVVSVRR